MPEPQSPLAFGQFYHRPSHHRPTTDYQSHLTLPTTEQIVLAKLMHTLNQLPPHRLTSLINHHATLTDRTYTDGKLISCYQAVAAICQH